MAGVGDIFYFSSYICEITVTRLQQVWGPSASWIRKITLEKASQRGQSSLPAYYLFALHFLAVVLSSERKELEQRTYSTSSTFVLDIMKKNLKPEIKILTRYYCSIPKRVVNLWTFERIIDWYIVYRSQLECHWPIRACTQSWENFNCCKKTMQSVPLVLDAAQSRSIVLGKSDETGSIQKVVQWRFLTIHKCSNCFLCFLLYYVK